jgi:hypothetical protein
MEHVATPAVALEARVQLPGGVKMPVELVVKLTEPVGVIMVPREVSLTVAAQLVPWFTTTEEGEQATLVEVARGPTVKVKAVPLVVVLGAWVPSPP